MLEVKEQGKKAVTKAFDVLILQEFGIIIVIIWNLKPFHHVVESLPILFDSQPHSYENKVGVVSICLSVVWCFYHWVASAVDRVSFSLALLETIVGK